MSALRQEPLIRMNSPAQPGNYTASMRLFASVNSLKTHEEVPSAEARRHIK
jgi:hypothetical protein